MMKRRLSLIKHQSGVALLVLMFALILAGGYAFYRSANMGLGKTQEATKRWATLARAKEALIARAVTDDNRPGSLPCPDTTGSGNTNWSLSRNDCDTYVGWLPWITLGIPELTDDSGTRLWYSLTPTLRDDDSAQPINSDTAGNLRVDGAGEIVAVIIAPGGALPGQNRPSNNIADYLDGENADADINFSSGPASDFFNDTLMVITRQELMAAVEKRIASELKTCLEQHAMNAPDLSYPWPAPLSNTIFKGQTKSLFGLVPATQPGGNPDTLLQQMNKDLADAQDTFATPISSDNSESKHSTILQLQETAAYARVLFDRLYIVATDLYNKALTLATSFDSLDKTLGEITDKSDVFLLRKSEISTAIDQAKPALNTSIVSLGNSGFDIFLMELEAKNTELLKRITAVETSPNEKNLSSLQTQTNVFKSKLFPNSLTPNAELSALLNSATTLASLAVDAAQLAKASPSDSALVRTAIDSAALLAAANQILKDTILRSRLLVEIDPLNIKEINEEAVKALASYLTKGQDIDLSALNNTLNSLKNNVELIGCDSAIVMDAKNVVLRSLASALSATSTEPTKIEATVSTAISETLKLISAKFNPVNLYYFAIDPKNLENINENITRSLDVYLMKREEIDLKTLSRSLSQLKSNVELIGGGSSAVITAKASVIISLAATCSAVATNSAQIEPAASTVISANRRLVDAITNNGDNIALETLKIVRDSLVAGAQTTPTTLTAGKEIRALTKLVSYWADIAADFSKDVAQQARKKPNAANDSSISAYVAANTLLNSLDGDSGTIKRLLQTSNDPSNSTNQLLAQQALNTTKKLFDTLIEKSNLLEGTLQSALADAAAPTKWLGASCTPFKPSTGSKTWWEANHWQDYVFYQINDRFRAQPSGEKCVGKLTLNGSGANCIVAISAGREIHKPNELNLNQDRKISREVSQYFEGSINSDASRNGDAQNPSAAFSSKEVSRNFNDRLAD
jgi:hypothetical protein